MAQEEPGDLGLKILSDKGMATLLGKLLMLIDVLAQDESNLEW